MELVIPGTNYGGFNKRMDRSTRSKSDGFYREHDQNYDMLLAGGKRAYTESSSHDQSLQRQLATQDDFVSGAVWYALEAKRRLFPKMQEKWKDYADYRRTGKKVSALSRFQLAERRLGIQRSGGSTSSKKKTQSQLTFRYKKSRRLNPDLPTNKPQPKRLGPPLPSNNPPPQKPTNSPRNTMVRTRRKRHRARRSRYRRRVRRPRRRRRRGRKVSISAALTRAAAPPVRIESQYHGSITNDINNVEWADLTSINGHAVMYSFKWWGEIVRILTQSSVLTSFDDEYTCYLSSIKRTFHLYNPGLANLHVTCYHVRCKGSALGNSPVQDLDDVLTDTTAYPVQLSGINKQIEKGLFTFQLSSIPAFKKLWAVKSRKSYILGPGKRRTITMHGKAGIYKGQRFDRAVDKTTTGDFGTGYLPGSEDFLFRVHGAINAGSDPTKIGLSIGQLLVVGKQVVTARKLPNTTPQTFCSWNTEDFDAVSTDVVTDVIMQDNLAS